MKFLTFIIKLNPNNGNKTKLAIFPSDIFKSDTIPLFIRDIQDTRDIQDISINFKIEISHFYD